VDAFGRSKTFEYDANDNVAAQTDALAAEELHVR
jgi:YD repeat-containing protein